MNSFRKNQEKVKVNILGNNFWFQPSIWTLSKRKYAARPYKNLKSLLKNEGLLSQNFIFTFNSDEDFELFRICQKMKDIDFYFNSKQIQEIDEKEYIEYTIKGSRITIRYDKKSLVAIKRGFIPYFSINWIKENFRGPSWINLLWTKKGYVEI